MRSMTTAVLGLIAACSTTGYAGDTLGPEVVPVHYSIEECHSYAEAAAALVEERNRGGDKSSMRNLLVGPEEARRDMLYLIDYVWSAQGVLAWSEAHQAKTALEQQCRGRKASREIGATID